MKKKTLLMLTISIFALHMQGAFAAPGGEEGKPPGQRQIEREQMARHMVEQLKKELGLTEEQVAAIEKAAAAEREKREAIRSNTSLTKEQKRQEMRASRQRMDAAIAAVLTPEQKTKWEEIRAQRKEKAGEGPGVKKWKEKNAPPAT